MKSNGKEREIRWIFATLKTEHNDGSSSTSFGPVIVKSAENLIMLHFYLYTNVLVHNYSNRPPAAAA
jgi:hypothetical protein